ncbi:XdhC family protein [Defluviitalea phaphyphila]|uniref:XdhC family protein n=1 Tax=Defluviitalea phaphyphila TaxID=1473580 RepID=UPI000731860C|nr:XdhC/CoxI family protein [Defluviitalea phaphyphila]
MNEIYEELIKMQKSGEQCMMVTVVESMGSTPSVVGKKMLVGESGSSFGTVGGGAIEYYAREKCKSLINEKKSVLEKYLLNEGKIVEDTKTLPMACGGKVSLFYEYIGPKAYVYIFGAGHVGQALTNVLKTMDFYVTLIDDRKEVYDSLKIYDRKVLSNYSEFLEKERIKDNSYVVICTPSHKYDYNVMNKIIELKLKPKYIGMLCSEKKLKEFVEKTYENFGRKIELTNFYAPIGLDIGGGSPEEIAISIASEILSVVYNKKGHKHMAAEIKW